MEEGSNRRRFRRVMNPAATYRPPRRSRFERVMDISPGTLELLAEELRREAERKQEDPRCIAA